MAETTAIAWTDHTFNAWMGCVRISPGCKFCYAETLAQGKFPAASWTLGGPRRFPSEGYWKDPLRWNAKAARAGERERVFCCSMADLFETHPDPAINAQMNAARARLWALTEATPHLDWLFLTKRPENLARYLPPAWRREARPNIWLGVSVENQRYAERRIPVLVQMPAVVHFLSVEPLLGPIPRLPLTGIEWVIVGGESGPRHRVMDMEAFAHVVAQCRAARVPVFPKQDSGAKQGQQGRIADDLWARKEFPRVRVAVRPDAP
jgi:protein gp37